MLEGMKEANDTTLPIDERLRKKKIWKILPLLQAGKILLTIGDLQKNTLFLAQHH